MSKASPVLDEFGRAFQHANGKPRPDIVEAILAAGTDGRRKHTWPRNARLSYDGASDTDAYANHWANADGKDADTANSEGVRKKFRDRSRYEAGSNGYYAGILETHVNMVVGVGPKLRMLTKNRNFNQMIEREFFNWASEVQLSRKLWCMCHAKAQDGEAFAILVNNPQLNGPIKLDLVLMEGDQCTTPYLRAEEKGYIDGIKFDEFDNVLWYDILPFHPGDGRNGYVNMDPIRVPPQSMLHWFHLKRPGSHRGIPAMHSTLNTGASSRRWREATLATAECLADYTMFIETTLSPNEAADPVAPSSVDIQKRQMTFLPMGWKAMQAKPEQPTATHDTFNRSLISEMARPMSMPYNAAACDSSTYSFASGKLDTLCYRAAIDVERASGDALVMDRIFSAWFKEFRLERRIADVALNHQWDWPVHPVIDAVAESTATDTKLKNGTLSLRQMYADNARDLEDELVIMAEDTFGDSSQESIDKMRKILALKNTPDAAIEYVAAILEVELPKPEPVEVTPPGEPPQKPRVKEGSNAAA